jgi:hypothetical protein
MERTKSNKPNLPDKNKLPDAIYRSKNPIGFTLIPNSLINNPNLNRDAKMIMITLLSNKNGEWITHVSKLQSLLNMGHNKIIAEMQRLTELGYVKRMKFRDKKTKLIKGFFLTYTDTPHMFDYHKNIEILDKQKMEIIPFKTPSNHHRSEIHDNGDPSDTSFSDMDKEGKRPERVIKSPSFQKHQGVAFDQANNTLIKKEEKQSKLGLTKLYEIREDLICPMKTNGWRFGYDYCKDETICVKCDYYKSDECEDTNEKIYHNKEILQLQEEEKKREPIKVYRSHFSSDDKCPIGYRFGLDFEKYKECDLCYKYDNCFDYGKILEKINKSSSKK